MPTAANLAHPKRDLIVLEKSLMLNNSSEYVFHCLGHFFGLPNTHDEINPNIPAVPGPLPPVLSQEFVDGSNCALHGDGFCDTEADPGTNVPLDGMGNRYMPPKGNYMSHQTGRCRYTLQQYNHMANVMLTTRFYLH